MTEGFDTALLGSGSLLKKGYSALIANVGKAVAIITLAVTVLVSFTDVGFSGIGTQSFTSTLVMMLIASYVMYFSLEDAGERLGYDSDEYKRAIARYDEKRKQISGKDISALRQFCLEYQAEELEYRRSNALLSLGYTKEEYEAYKRGEITAPKAKRALARIDRIRRSEFTATDLLLSKGTKPGSELRRPGTSKIINMVIRLIPSTVCTFFTVSVIISAKDGLTFSSVVESILKLSTLPIIGLKGYSLGYEYVLGPEISWIEMKTELLDAFIKRRDA